MRDPLAATRATATRATATRATATGADRFEAQAPDWFGPRVFGGIVVAQALSAAVRPPLDRPDRAGRLCMSMAQELLIRPFPSQGSPERPAGS